MQSTERETRSTRAQLRRQAAEIKTEELNEALSSFDSGTELTDTQQEIVEEMGAAIVEGILVPVEAKLERVPDDDPLARTVVSLFDLREESENSVGPS